MYRKEKERKYNKFSFLFPFQQYVKKDIKIFQKKMELKAKKVVAKYQQQKEIKPYRRSSKEM